MKKIKLLSERDKRTLRVIYRYYTFDKLREIFKLTKKELEYNLEKENLPIKLVGSGKKNMFSAKKENIIKKPGRRERHENSLAEVEKIIKKMDIIDSMKAEEISYSNCLARSRLVEIARKHGKYQETVNVNKYNRDDDV